MFKIAGKKSEVEKNKIFVSVGMYLYLNGQRYIVTDVFEDYFSACDTDDMEEDYFFEELDEGWKFHEEFVGRYNGLWKD